MRILRNEAAIAALPNDTLRRLIEKRVAEINETIQTQPQTLP